MRETAGSASGRLSIEASNTIGRHVLPSILARFPHERLEVRATLFVGNTARFSKGVGDLRFLPDLPAIEWRMLECASAAGRSAPTLSGSCDRPVSAIRSRRSGDDEQSAGERRGGSAGHP